MADTNAQLEELTRLLGQVNYEMEMFGRVTKRTADEMYDAEMKDKLGINNATKGMAALADGLTSLAGAAGAAGKAMLDGKKGAGAFNDSIDGMAKAATAAAIALALMNPFGKVVGLLIAGVALAATALADYTKKANDMADKLYKGYSGLSKAGAAASDGMTGVYKGAKKLGLSMNELDGYVSLVAANSKDLALFSGSVFEGRKKLEDMGGALEGSREDFLKMGMSMTDMTDGMLGYLKIQTRLGNAQGKTTDELAAGAKKYLVEQDQLTKLTGQTRKEMEDQRERALQGEQFAAKIRQLQLEGDAGKKAAEELLKMNAIYEAAGPKMAAAFQATVTGNLSNADAQAANLASNGAMMETTQKVIAGQMKYTDAVDITGKAMGQTADTVGVVLGQFGAYNESFGPINEQLKLAQMAQNGITESMAKIKADQEKILAGGVDPMLKAQAELINKQIDANKATEDFIKKGIEPAQKAMKYLAELTIAGANKLNELTPGGKAMTDNTKGQLAGGAVGAIAGNYAGKKAAGAISESASKKVAGAVTSKVVGKALGGAIGGIAGSIVPGAGTIIGGIAGAFIGDAIGEWMGKTFFGGEDAPVAPEPEARASGGPVTPGKTYKVGEKGEELFTPKVAGEIIPNNKIADIISSITGTSKSMTTGSRELGDAFDEIVKDSQKLEKLNKDTIHSFDEILSTVNMASESMTSGYGKLDNSFDKILSTLNMSSESMTTGYQDLDGSFKEILSTVDAGAKLMTTGYQDLDGSFDKILSTLNMSSESITTKHQDLDGSFDNILSTVDTGSKSLTIKYQDLDSSFDKILSTLNAVSKSMTTGYRELDDSFVEIAKDSLKIEKLTDSDTKRAEKYSIAYKSYVDLKTQLMDLESPQAPSAPSEPSNLPATTSSVTTTAASDTVKSLVSALTVVSKSMTTGSREMDDSFDEIVKDSQKLEKLTDTDTKRAEKYSITYKSYVDLKNQLMDLETPDLKKQINLLQEKAFQASTGGTSVPNSALVNSTISGASGGGAPGGSNMPSMGGGQGISAPVPPGAGEGATSAGGGDSKPKLGTISSKGGKSTSVAADAAPAFQQLLDYLDSVGYEIKSLGGYVDRDVRGQPGVKSAHAKGGAIDINPAENPMGSALVTDMPEGIKQLASSLGLGWGGAWNSVKDAMHFSAAKNEGGRIMAKEGIQVDGPETGYPATLHGKEAVIPMKNGSGDFVKMFEDMSESNRNLVEELKAGRQQNFELLGLVQDLVRSQKDSTSIQERILQTSM